MNSYPKVTIGIPCYNQENFIETTIMSVLSQDYPNLEIIVSDDYSSDNTNEKIVDLKEKYNFQYFRNDKNIGMVANYRKILFEYATGEWYLNLDGDDLLANKSVISDILGIINKSKIGEVILFTGKVKPIKFNSPISNKIAIEAFEVSGINYFKNYSIKRNFGHAACIYNREIALKLNFYSINVLNTDFHSLIKLCFHGNIIVTENVIAFWREHENNQSLKVNAEKGSKIIDVYYDIINYAKNFISKKSIDRWMGYKMNEAEFTRTAHIVNLNGLLTGLKSHFTVEKRLTKNINLKTIIKLVFLSFKSILKTK